MAFYEEAPLTLEEAKELTREFMVAESRLGMFAQAAMNERSDLVAYAEENALTWAMPQFLHVHGLMDDDWVERLRSVAN